MDLFFGVMHVPAELPLLLLHCDRTSLEILLAYFWSLCKTSKVQDACLPKLQSISQRLSQKFFFCFLSFALLSEKVFSTDMCWSHWLYQFHGHLFCKASYKAQNFVFNYCYTFTSTTLPYTSNTSKTWVYLGLNLTWSSVRYSESWYQLQYEFPLFIFALLWKNSFRISRRLNQHNFLLEISSNSDRS